ncbi:MAG: hypothetical protein AAF352_03455 [Pseudomonadota bacterium]
MNDQQMDKAAKELAQAWARGEALAAPPDDWPPASRHQAYDLLDRFAANVQEDCVGWKMGMSAQKLEWVAEYQGPIPGRIFASRVFENGAILPKQIFGHTKVEAELAFRINQNFRARAGGYSFAEMTPHITMLPCAELVKPNLPLQLALENADQLIADNSACVGVVIGEEITDWQSLDCDTHPITLMLDAEGPIAPLTGLDRANPAHTLENLMVFLGQRNRDLPRGSIVTTGTTNVPPLIAAGNKVNIDYGWAGMLNFTIET